MFGCNIKVSDILLTLSRGKQSAIAGVILTHPQRRLRRVEKIKANGPAIGKNRI
jgi:hypothetical protein